MKNDPYIELRIKRGFLYVAKSQIVTVKPRRDSKDSWTEVRLTGGLCIVTEEDLDTVLDKWAGREKA